MKRNSYDALARYYDFISLVLGRSYRQSKTLFLDRIKEGDAVLYIGGGTGANLPEIVRRIGSNGRVYYIEGSSRMINMAMKRVRSEPARVEFLHQSAFSQIPHESYDVVLTQYLLDILSEDDMEELLSAVGLRAKPAARWIFVDFFPVSRRRWLIRLMIWFFRWTTGNPRNDLPDYAYYFRKHGWLVEEKKTRKGGFMQAWILKRKG